MSLNKASITMQAVCAAKAADKELSKLDPINHLIYTLLPQADEHRRTMDNYSNGMFTHTVYFRKKFFSDVLHESAENYSQLIVICGGLDFSCLNTEKWKMQAKFFIDHPLSLALSLPLLKQANVSTTAIEFIGLDLADKNAGGQLSALLLEKGLNLNKPTLVIWEGATYYIEKTRVSEVIETLAKLIPQLKLAFDFILAEPEISTDKTELKGMKNSLKYIKKHNEPWQSKFLDVEMKEKLTACGFDKLDLKTDKEIIHRFKLELSHYRKMFGFIIAEKHKNFS